jgi:hypothetical protein
VETVRRTTLYVLFMIERGTRRVRLAGVTRHPDGFWVVQRAREFSMGEGERAPGTTRPWFLIRDRDSKFTRAFDDVFAADGTQIITTPVQAPTPTRSPSGGYRRSGRSAWTGCCSGVVATLSGSSRSMCGTTTTSGRIEAFSFARRGVTAPDLRRRPLSRSPPAFGVGIVSGAWFTSTTRPRHDVQVSEPYGQHPTPSMPSKS